MRRLSRRTLTTLLIIMVVVVSKVKTENWNGERVMNSCNADNVYPC